MYALQFQVRDVMVVLFLAQICFGACKSLQHFFYNGGFLVVCILGQF